MGNSSDHPMITCINLKKSEGNFWILNGSRIGSLGNIIFDIIEPPAVQKYSICWVFLALRHKLYLCICEFVFVYLTVGNISFDVLGPWAYIAL